MEKQPLLMRIGFTRGVKVSRDPSSVPVGSVWDALNVKADETGILRTRDGCEAVMASLGVGPVQAAISAFDGILFVWNQHLYKKTDAGVTLIDGTITLGGTPSTPVELIKWSRSGQEIVYVLSSHGLYETNGTTLTLTVPYTPLAEEPTNLLRKEDGTQDTASGPAEAQFGILRASLSQRLAVAGGPTRPNTVYLSAPLDATYWPAEQVIQLPNDGGKITGLANWYGALVIFRDKDIWAFFGTEVGTGASLVLQERAIGCVAGRTIASVPGIDLLFLGPDNVYLLTGVSGVENQVRAIPIGHDILPLLKTALSYGVEGACGIYFKDEYRLCLPQALSDAKVFRLRLQNNAGWFPDTGPRSSLFFTYKEALYGGRWQYGQLIKFTDRLLDVDEPILFYTAFGREALLPGSASVTRLYLYVMAKGRTRTAPLFFFGPVFNAVPFNIAQEPEVTYIVGTDQHLSVSLIVDGNEFTVKNFVVHDSITAFAQLSRVEPVRVYEARFRPSLKGHFIQVKINGKIPEEDIAILGYGLEYAVSGQLRAKTEGVTV